MVTSDHVGYSFSVLHLYYRIANEPVLFHWSDPVGPDLAVFFEAKRPTRPGPTGSNIEKERVQFQSSSNKCFILT